MHILYPIRLKYDMVAQKCQGFFNRNNRGVCGPGGFRGHRRIVMHCRSLPKTGKIRSNGLPIIKDGSGKEVPKLFYTISTTPGTEVISWYESSPFHLRWFS